MMDKFKNKYKIKSTRLNGYDYSQNGMYFVTICSKNHEHYFGEVVDGIMQLSEIGKIAENFWKEIPNYFPFVVLDEFVVMPNHIHGIIEIMNNGEIEIGRDEAVPRLYVGCNLKMSEISPKPGSLSVIIGSFKSITSKTVRKKYLHINFHWQSRFYDHIIRNDESLNKIREYIIENPRMWEQDKNNIENIWL